MRRAIAVFALSVVVAGCRTARPAGEETPLVPLTPTSANDAARQLATRRAQMTTGRSLMRIRATHAGQSLSFRAQLQADNRGRMLLTAYTPFGTNAMRLYASGDEVTFVNDFEGTWWHGNAAEFGSSFGFFGSMPPASMGLMMLGLPAAGNEAAYEYAPTGLKRATVGDVVVTYDPPSYPPQHVLIARAAQSLDIAISESVMTTGPIAPPVIPSGYRCCVAPKM